MLSIRECAAVQGGGIWGFGIFDNGDQAKIDAAKTFIDFICNDPDQVNESVKASTYFPVRPTLTGIYDGTDTADVMNTFSTHFMPSMGDLAWSPLSKIPKPQIPPQSSVLPSSEGNSIGMIVFEAADAMQYLDLETHTWTTENFMKAVQAVYDSGQQNVAAIYCSGLTVIGREQHRDDRIAVVCLACFAVVGIGLLCSIPAQGHCQCAVTE